ncbi:hypothetical protein LEP1GSC125_2321 [Leptospira mayottensis 200901122]|uniref:Uncharacterized protein n=1 Tax=Leptospira mayottensis 200901122 TaxID=1193010 RepID=A0AA87SZA0_9LEPT|nr:hypothetical protein LEP1GSC125_2321 [Leptospira mayottensis 200901122]
MVISSHSLRNRPTDPEKMEIHVESSIREFVEFKRKYDKGLELGEAFTSIENNP